MSPAPSSPASLTFEEILARAATQRLAVVSTVAADGSPQSAVVGIGVSATGEIVFDTLGDTRKCRNLRRDPRVALVIGWDDEWTIQMEGLADEPRDEELAALQKVYFAAYPDGPTRLSWPGLTYVRVRPTWVRFSDFREASRGVVEMTAARQETR